jgi:hypothetical protein
MFASKSCHVCIQNQAMLASQSCRVRIHNHALFAPKSCHVCIQNHAICTQTAANRFGVFNASMLHMYLAALMVWTVLYRTDQATIDIFASTTLLGIAHFSDRCVESSGT